MSGFFLGFLGFTCALFFNIFYGFLLNAWDNVMGGGKNYCKNPRGFKATTVYERHP